MLRKAICVALATVCASCVLASASRGRVRAPAMCGQPYRMALRGGGKNKDRRHNLEGAEYGDARKEKIAERVAVAAEELQEKLKLAREEVQIEVCSRSLVVLISQSAYAGRAVAPGPAQMMCVRLCSSAFYVHAQTLAGKLVTDSACIPVPRSACCYRTLPQWGGHLPTLIGRPCSWKQRWSRRESFPRSDGATKK